MPGKLKKETTALELAIDYLKDQEDDFGYYLDGMWEIESPESESIIKELEALQAKLKGENHESN